MFLWTPKGFISPESFLNFFLNLYIPLWLQKSFKFMLLRLLANTFVGEKLNLFIFTQAPKQNSPPGFYHYPFLPNSNFWRFIFSPVERGGGMGGKIMESRKLPKLNLQWYWSQVLINSTIFATFTFLVSALFCHNLASSILKCEGSLT